MESTKLPIVLSCLIMIITLMSTPITCTILGFGQHIPRLPRKFVNSHNPARAILGLPLLVWNDTLAAYAQGYANQRANDCALQHSQGPYGENLAMGSWDMSPREAVNMWVGEKLFYDYGSNSCIGGNQCLHYTQVVWRNTKSVGCAKVRCRNNGWTFITCNYYPPGNYIGERPY